MRFFPRFSLLLALSGPALLGSLAAAGTAQTPAPAAPPPAPESQQPAPPPAHRGQILIQSHEGDIAAPAPDTANPAPQWAQPGADARVDVSDADREAVTFTRYDLDARLRLQSAGLEVRARITVRNDGKAPLAHIPLQISSSLRWENATLVSGAERLKLPLAQHRLDTDTDHTGAATEAVLTLPAPLAPGAEVSLDLFYAGTAAQSGARLARLGAGTAQQAHADWDAVGPAWTGLRGFGDVLWFPVASPQLFLADGNSLFTAIGRMRLREQAAAVRLRLSVEYTGEAPAAAYFCGRRAALKAVADDPDAPVATGSGIATADFSEEPLGFRTLTLFVVENAETLLGATTPGTASAEPVTPASPVFSSSNPATASPAPATAPSPARPRTASVSFEEPLVALASADPATGTGLGSAADRAAALLAEWMGNRPLSALTVLDHSGQPFQDGPLLVAPAATLQTSPELPALAYSLTHAWVQTGQPWIDEGLAQFFALLTTEREAGREAALDQLNGLLQPVALAEPDLASATDSKPGQPLISAADELFYRRKAAAVWWMLRDIAGESALRSALSAWRTQPASRDTPETQAVAFERVLEKLSGKDLGWFFSDWVLRDRGLPDLSIAEVSTSRTPAGQGHNAGWLVALTVRNEGAAAAEVPFSVRSGQFTTGGRIRVPAFGRTTERVLVESSPTEVVVNDGSTPEQRVSRHTRRLEAAPQP